jgi:glycosyltransferase involved in cell wall biosynthesis
VLFLAGYFPKPNNPFMGTWALAQAQALLRHGLDLKVLSFTSWVPAIAAVTRGARTFAGCPPRHRFGDLEVEYPRWLLYQAGPPKRWAHRDPRRQLALAWWSARGALRRAVSRHRPDVVFAHHTLTSGYLAARLREEGGPPFVVTDHDFDEIADCGRFPGRRAAFARVAGRASALVSVSRRMEADVRRIFPGAPAVTVWNGVDAPPPETLAGRRTPGAGGGPVVFSCGLFAERKGFPLLVRAFARAARGNPGARLRIAGDGDGRSSIEAAIREAGAGDRVTLLGLLPHGEVLREMADCDLFALPSWDEPFATVFLEAMSCGRPIIWGSDGGISDVARDGVHGLAVAPRDEPAAAEALARLLADPAARERMGAAARDLHREKLTWQANARAMEELFARAAAGG